MIPAAFDYHVPAAIAEATALLAQYGEDAKVLSGGQSLIPMMKLRLASPRHVVDINRIPGLAYVRETDGVLAIGALARESDLEESDLVRARYPILADTTKVIADPIVRNLATVCGNLAHGDPANDHPATMLALGAELVAVGPAGTRRLPADAFFTGPFTTALAADEILTEIRIPAPPPRSGGAYVKLERKVGDFATAAVAVQVTLGPGGTCERAGIGLTDVGPTPIQARRVEAFLTGKRLEQGNIRGGSFIDYLVPTAVETPKWETDKTCTPSPHHPLGAKGVGESATVGAPAAIANAVVDAMWHLGVRHVDIPITPAKVWKLLRDHGVTE